MKDNNDLRELEIRIAGHKEGYVVNGAGPKTIGE